MIDILCLAHKRPEFTRESLKALCTNTDLSLARSDYDVDWSRLCVYSDGEALPEMQCARFYNNAKYGGPVACLSYFLDQSSSEFIAKIDNDTIVPPGWLPACLDLMRRYPNVDLLGIEPWTPDAKLFPTWKEPACIGGMTFPIVPGKVPICTVRALDGFTPRPVSHIGGIGVFRRSAFERFGRPVPNSKDGRYGMTEWQWANGSMVKAFIDPPLPVFLLDHLPFDPWLSLSAKYEQEGIQRRQWGSYPEQCKGLWGWWKS